MGRDISDLWRRPMKELVGPKTKESNDTEESQRATIVDLIQRIPGPGMKNQNRVFNPHILMEHHGIKDKGRVRSSTNPTRFSLKIPLLS